MNTTQVEDDGTNLALKELSFIIEASGQIVPVLPDGNEFSPRHMHEYLAGPPELLCLTHNGFFLFRNKEAQAHGLPVNELATAMYLKPSQTLDHLVGRVFVAHPDHIAAYMRTR